MGYRKKKSKRGILERPPKEYQIYDYRPQLNYKLLELGLLAYKFGKQAYKSLPKESYTKNPQAYGMSPGEHLWEEFRGPMGMSHPELWARSEQYGNSLFKVPDPNAKVLPDRTNDYLKEAERRIEEASLVSNQAFNVKPRDHISVEARIGSSYRSEKFKPTLKTIYEKPEYRSKPFKPALQTIVEETEDIGSRSYGKKILEKPSVASAVEKETVTIQPYPYPIKKKISPPGKALKKRKGKGQVILKFGSSLGGKK